MARKKTSGAGGGTDLREGAASTGTLGLGFAADEKSPRKPGKAAAETPTAKVTAQGRDIPDSLADRGPEGSAVRVLDVEVPAARGLLTTTPNAHAEVLGSSEGAIVRLRAQVGDSDGDVTRARAALEVVAARVVVVPAPRSAAPIVELAKPTARTARDAALALVEEGAFYDKPALTALVEELLVEQGL
jgi:hypothetical protein